jgi:hypothetical protein
MMAKVTNIVVQIDEDILKQLLDKISTLEARVAELERSLELERKMAFL